MTLLDQAAVSPSGDLHFDTIRLATGIRMHYAVQGDEHAQPVVFLHGYSDSWWSFSRLLPLLPLDRYRAFALDLRGHGDSDRPLTGYRVEDFAADVVAFLDAMGLAQVDLVGHSLGSIIGRRMAELYPERISRLVLIGSAATPFGPAISQMKEAIFAFGDEIPEEFVREFQTSTLYAPVPEAFYERVIGESRKLPAHVWRGVVEGLLEANDSQELHRIQATTLMLWGEQDTYFPRAEQDTIAQGISSARLVVLPEIGHAVQWEDPATVAEHLQAFLVYAQRL